MNVISLCFAYLIAFSTAAPFDELFEEKGNVARQLDDPDEETDETRHDFVHERGSEFEGDIIMPMGIFGGDGNVKTWTGKQIPYTLDPAISTSEISKIGEGIAEIHNKTCIRLVPRTAQKNYVRFTKTGAKGCSSNIGMVGRGEQKINLASGCYSKHTVAHEIVHAIGFWHEQSRKDRDKYVQINFDNIETHHTHNFVKYSDTNDYGYAYDYASIMHYSAYAFAKNKQIPTIIPKLDFPKEKFGKGDGKGGMTEIDAAQINKMYGC